MAYGDVLSALADPTRRRVFERLRSRPRPLGAIARGMPVSRPAVSQHLKALKDAGLVADRQEGTKGKGQMTPTVTIAPVRKSIRVNASQAHAFDVFTSGLGRWWPLDHGIGKTPRKAAVMETRVGGHWYELAEDGTRTNVGK